MLVNGESGVLEHVFDAETNADGNSRSEEAPQADYLEQLVNPFHYATSLLEFGESAQIVWRAVQSG